MNRPDDITATEKLLDVIRKNQDVISLPPQPQETLPPGKKRNFRFAVPAIVNLSPLVSSIGVEMGDDCIRLARISRLPGGHWNVEALSKFAIPAHLSKDDHEFGEFLKTSLDTFTGPSRKTKIWAIMSAEGVEIHNIRIPKLPPPKVANAVYWTLKKNAPFDEQKLFFDFEIQGETIEQGIAKLSVMAYIAPRQEIEAIRMLFARIGRPLTGISIASFVFQNLLRRDMTEEKGKVITTLFLGNDSSRIDIYASGNLVMTRGIKAGTNSMIEALVDSYNYSKPHAPQLTFEKGREILFNICRKSQSFSPPDTGLGIDENEIFEMIRPALERVVRQIDMTFKYFSTEQQQGKIARIFVSGAMSVYRPVLDYIGNNLEIACDMLDPLSDNDAISLRCDMNDCDCLYERSAFTTALGGAISDNDYTPNFIFTFKDKERVASVKKINRGVFAVFIAAVIVLGAVFYYQDYDIDRKQALIAGLEKTLAGTGPVVDQTQLMKLAGQISRQRNISMVYADRYIGMALLSELATLTPSSIRLINLKMKLGRIPSPEAAKNTGEGAKGQTGGSISLEGLILGERRTAETSLAGYVMALEASPLFSRVSVEKSAAEPNLNDAYFYFTLTLQGEDDTHG